jgi:hypothetical protein
MTKDRSRVDLPSDLCSPIFIGGQRRSGTTLVRVLLNRHPHIACGPESKFVQHPSFATWHEQLSTEWAQRVERYGLGPDSVDRAMAALVDHLFSSYARREGKIRWAEKTPTNILHIDYLFRLFPRAQFLHVIRDPRDTYCSIRQRAQTDKPHWARFSAKRSAMDWRESVCAGMRHRHEEDRYYEFKYETLVQDADATMRGVLDFLNEPWDARIFDPGADNAEAQGANIDRHRLSCTSVGRWRNELSSHDLRKIQSIAGDLMIELGYGLA